MIDKTGLTGESAYKVSWSIDRGQPSVGDGRPIYFGRSSGGSGIETGVKESVGHDHDRRPRREAGRIAVSA